MADSRHSYRPDATTDVLGFLSWEYDRIRTMTMRRSATFAYGYSGFQLGSREKDKGAASPAFAFHTMFDFKAAPNHHLPVNAESAKRQCVADVMVSDIPSS